MSDEDLEKIFRQVLEEQVKAQYAAAAAEQLAPMTPAQLALVRWTCCGRLYGWNRCAAYYDEVLEFSESSYADNLVELGCLDLDAPASVNLYASSFENKDVIEDAIADYNASVEELADPLHRLCRPYDVFGDVDHQRHHLCADRVCGHFPHCVLHYDRGSSP